MQVPYRSKGELVNPQNESALKGDRKSGIFILATGTERYHSGETANRWTGHVAMAYLTSNLTDSQPFPLLDWHREAVPAAGPRHFKIERRRL